MAMKSRQARDGTPPRPGAPGRANRNERIALMAYYKAQQRGFAPGFEVEDWLAAEREYDAAVASAGQGEGARPPAGKGGRARRSATRRRRPSGARGGDT